MVGLIGRAVLIYIPLAVLATLVLFISYINDQQTLRQLANEPQEILASDALARLSGSEKKEIVFGGSHVAIESDTAPYIILFDATGTPVIGTGYLHGTLPTPPKGIFEEAHIRSYHVLTWEPEPAIREAIFIKALPNGTGFILAGRSLAYTEYQIEQLGLRSLIGWLGTLFALLVTSVISAFLSRKL